MFGFDLWKGMSTVTLRTIFHGKLRGKKKGKVVMGFVFILLGCFLLVLVLGLFVCLVFCCCLSWSQFNFSSIRTFPTSRIFPENAIIHGICFFNKLSSELMIQLSEKLYCLMEESLFASWFCKAKHFSWKDHNSPRKHLFSLKRLYHISKLKMEL